MFLTISCNRSSDRVLSYAQNLDENLKKAAYLRCMFRTFNHPREQEYATIREVTNESIPFRRRSAKNAASRVVWMYWSARLRCSYNSRSASSSILFATAAEVMALLLHWAQPQAARTIFAGDR